MRFPKLFPSVPRASRRSGRPSTRRARLAAAERLEPRFNLAATIIDLAAPRPAGGSTAEFPAYPTFPIPAGATLVDVSETGQHVLFSSTDTNVIAGQQTIPSAHPNLFWLDTMTGITRLVTHRAGSEVQSAGYAGINIGSSSYTPGYGLWPIFEPGTADISADGKSVVFDSIVTANEYDATVPLQNDQATWRPPMSNEGTPAWQNLQTGTADVFVWNADGDPANNISLVSRLNAKGRGEAVRLVVPGVPVPIEGSPMATGVFAEESLPPPSGQFQGFVEPVESFTLNKGITADGKRVLYDSLVPAGWIDVARPTILDQEATNKTWTLDCFVADLAGFGGGGKWSGKTVSVTSNGTEALGYYEGPSGVQQAELFEPMFSQISDEGNRVVYSTRRQSTAVVAGTTDSDFSLDVFTHDVAAGTNLLVSRFWNDATKAAGAAQPNFFGGGGNPFAGATPPTELWDSQNHSISGDGLTIALTSSAGNLVEGWKDVTADIAPIEVIGPNGGLNWTTYQANPVDIYGFRFTAANSSGGTAALVNSPDGLANTNRIANFGGMSSDGTTFLFGTAANNFYQPGFTSPYPFTQNLPQVPLPLNFILGGFSNLWVRKITWGATATGITSLVSVGFSVDADGEPDVSGRPNASGNKATLASQTPPGSRDVLGTISERGRFVMFSSGANNLAQGVYDKSFKGGVFVRDLETLRTTLLTTTTTGNVPSVGLFTNFALATKEGDATPAAPPPRFSTYVDGTGASDMQTRFRTENVAPAPTSHVYRIDYPAVSQAASATSPAIFTVSGEGETTRPVFEFRDPFPPLMEPSIRMAFGQIVPSYFREWRTATGDINADGVVDYVYGAGLGQGGEDTVVVIDGRTNSVIWSVSRMFPAVPRATGPASRPGVFVATADVNCDGFADVIVGSDGKRQSQVKVYSGRRGFLLESLQPFGPRARLAVRVAGGDVDGDGYGDIVAGRGPGGPARVAVYSGRRLTLNQSQQQALLTDSVVAGGNNGGMYLAAADMNRDGRSEVVVGFDRAQTVSVYRYVEVPGTNNVLVQMSSRNLGAAFRGGVRVAARAGQVMVASGPGTGPTIQLFAYADGSPNPWTLTSDLKDAKIRGFTANDTRGVYVG